MRFSIAVQSQRAVYVNPGFEKLEIMGRGFCPRLAVPERVFGVSNVVNIIKTHHI